MKTRLALVALAVSLALAACSKKEEPVAAAPANAQFQNHARVLQVAEAGGYTYLEVMGETGERVWLAGAPIKAKAGDSVSFGQYSVLQNFESKALNRKFDRIVFVEAWSVGGAPAAKVAAHGTVPPGAPGASGALPPGHPPMGAAPMGNAPMAAGGQNSGVVKTAQTAGGYTYVEVQQGAGTMWIAGPETQVKVGDKVAWDGGAVMSNFTAKSLNRTFDKIVFAGGIAVVK
jgi:hypothetical protein